MRFPRILLAVLLLSSYCAPQIASPDDGSALDNVYTNFYFRFRYPFTASWVTQPASVAEELQNAGGAKAASDEAKPHYLLTLSRTIPGQGPAGRTHAVISLVAKDNAAHPELASGQEVVLALVNKMKARRYTAIGEPQAIKIGGHSFFRQDMKGPASAGTPVYESMVFTVTKGYSFGFVLASPSQTLLTSMVATLEKAEFF